MQKYRKFLRPSKARSAGASKAVSDALAMSRSEDLLQKCNDGLQGMMNAAVLTHESGNEMRHDQVNCSDYCTSDCGCGCHIRLALKRLPTFAAGIYDPLYHKRVSDLRFAVQTELDTYEEGDNPLEPRQVTALRKFLDYTSTS